MKQVTFMAALIAAFTLFSINMSAQGKPTEEALQNLKPYPEKMDSLERYVIYVDQKADESLFEIELIAGKTMEVDCNNHRLMGRFQEEVVEGWGYPYYVFETEGHIMSTMMMCPGPKTEKFISGENLSARYNSRLPLVVYLPAGYELKYKVWTAGDLQAAEKQ